MPVIQDWKTKNQAKVCIGCNLSLPVATFSWKKRVSNLRQAHCRVCVSKKNKINRPENLARERQWAAKNPDLVRSKNHRELLRKHYNLKPEDYVALLKAQNGRCAICQTENPGRKNRYNLQVDHCHKTGKVRGLLCHSCNLGIGHLKDDPRLIRSALRYLKGAA